MRTDHVVLAVPTSLLWDGAAVLPRDRRKSASRLRRPRLLWVDDSAPLLSLYKSVFESLGFEVLTTTSPEEALLYHGAHSTAPDAVILDYDMPTMNGAALAALIKDHYPLTPVILYSGNTSLPAGAQEGVNAICTKGAPREELLPRLKRFCLGDCPLAEDCCAQPGTSLTANRFSRPRLPMARLITVLPTIEETFNREKSYWHDHLRNFVERGCLRPNHANTSGADRRHSYSITSFVITSIRNVESGCADLNQLRREKVEGMPAVRRRKVRFAGKAWQGDRSGGVPGARLSCGPYGHGARYVFDWRDEQSILNDGVASDIRGLEARYGLRQLRIRQNQDRPANLRCQRETQSLSQIVRNRRCTLWHTSPATDRL